MSEFFFGPKTVDWVMLILPVAIGLLAAFATFKTSPDEVKKSSKRKANSAIVKTKSRVTSYGWIFISSTLILGYYSVLKYNFDQSEKQDSDTKTIQILTKSDSIKTLVRSQYDFAVKQANSDSLIFIKIDRALRKQGQYLDKNFNLTGNAVKIVESPFIVVDGGSKNNSLIGNSDNRKYEVNFHYKKPLKQTIKKPQ